MHENVSLHAEAWAVAVRTDRYDEPNGVLRGGWRHVISSAQGGESNRLLITGAAGNMGKLLRPLLRRDDRILRVMIARNEIPPAFVEWVDR